MEIALGILRVLAKEPRQTPQTLQEKLGVSLSSIKSALRFLHELDHIKRLAHGLYIITPLGEYILRKNEEEG